MKNKCFNFTGILTEEKIKNILMEINKKCKCKNKTCKIKLNGNNYNLSALKTKPDLFTNKEVTIKCTCNDDMPNINFPDPKPKKKKKSNSYDIDF